MLHFFEKKPQNKIAIFDENRDFPWYVHRKNRHFSLNFSRPI